jgi:hypothetical protein
MGLFVSGGRRGGHRSLPRAHDATLITDATTMRQHPAISVPRPYPRTKVVGPVPSEGSSWRLSRLRWRSGIQYMTAPQRVITRPVSPTRVEFATLLTPGHGPTSDESLSTRQSPCSVSLSMADLVEPALAPMAHRQCPDPEGGAPVPGLQLGFALRQSGLARHQGYRQRPRRESLPARRTS